jgi:hypothetical protein
MLEAIILNPNTFAKRKIRTRSNIVLVLLNRRNFVKCVCRFVKANSLFFMVSNIIADKDA